MNNDGNSLHGATSATTNGSGPPSRPVDAANPAVKLTLLDPDGMQGFPGTVRVEVVYTLTFDDTLRIVYHATTDKATPINLTNHSYFNLKDGGKSPITDHQLQLSSDQYTPVNGKLIPTGKIASVKGTPFDFSSPKAMGRDLEAAGGTPVGYDQNFVIPGGPALRLAAKVYEPTSGRVLQEWTTEPGVQFYTGNFLDGTLSGKSGTKYQPHAAFCLEAQHYPDSINQPNFPSTVLRPGETYQQTTEYRFSSADAMP